MKNYLFVFLALICFQQVNFAQGFNPAIGLTGASLNNPTSLQFGPDSRLYVSQQNGEIKAYTIVRNGLNDYVVTATETIDLVQNIPNHNDDGTLHTEKIERQVTGILLKGTANNPILYVTSSDYRIGGGTSRGDKNLDTNSGVISKLTKNNNGWTKVDLVRGLPRSEENHATNGIQIDDATNTMYVAQGGHTNAGSPSNNFAFITEYALSAAVLTVDLDAIEAMPDNTDPQSGQTYKYNLPTVDDPTRSNNNGQDVNDPFGGNDGLNQATIVSGGPVQIYAPGFRNIYDLVLTENGRLYTWDNGANQGWGGHPDNEGGASVTNNWVSGEPGSNDPGPNDAIVNNLDGLHHVTGANYYGGHPNPIRANPSGAGLFTNDQAGGENGVWRTGITGSSATTLPTDWPPLPSSAANPIEGDFQNPGVDDQTLFTIQASTNGMTEYTASNLNNSLKGNLLAASFNEKIYNINLNNAGSINSDDDVSVFSSNFGSNPLDVTAQGDDDIFPGTVWAATYGADDITIFEPVDYGDSQQGAEDIYINCGGSSLTFSGTTWEADTHFANGNPFSVNNAINGTSSDALYQTERWFANLAYNIPVQNGTMDVELHFAEIFINAQNSGARVFDVFIEGNLVLNDLDIFDEVGGYTALVETFTVNVSDGTLNITMQSSANNAKLSAIAVKFEQTQACTGAYSNTIDEDNDNFTNADEIDNGSDPCNGAIRPPDFDGTFINGFLVSNLNDPDDDDDGILDNTDKFAWDANNGQGNTLPIDYPFLNGDPGFGFFGLGFTGLMTNNTDDYLDLIKDEDNSDTEIIAGGAVGLFTINNVSDGDAVNNNNNQHNAYQFGIDVNSSTPPFTIESALVGPVFTAAPDKFQSQGIYIGNGDQNNYLKVTVFADRGNPVIQIGNEVNSTLSSQNIPVENIGTVLGLSLFLKVNPANGIVQAQYSIDGGQAIDIGNPVTLSGATLTALQSSSQSLAVGVISTTFNSDPNFNATWDYLKINTDNAPPPNSIGNWDYINDGASCSTFGNIGSCSDGRHEASYVEVGDKFVLLGGRENGSRVNIYDPITNVWTLGATPPISLHHFQAVEYHGMILVVGAMTGSCCNEPGTDKMYLYDPIADQWHDGPDVPNSRQRGGAGCVVHNGDIYLLSGTTTGHQASGWVTWFDKYEPETDTWTQLPDAPRARDHFHAAVIGNKLYAAAGRRSGADGIFNETISEVDVFNFNTNTWQTLPNDIPTERAGNTVAVLGNELIVIGGEREAGAAKSETEALNVNTNTWRDLADLNTGRHGTQAIVNNENIWVATGSPNRGGGQILSQERFYFDTPNTPILTSINKSNLTSPANQTVNGTEIITFTNTSGNQAILIEDINVSGNFQYNLYTDLPFILKPGADYDMEVSYTESGAETGILSISHTGDNNANVTLFGGSEPSECDAVVFQTNEIVSYAGNQDRGTFTVLDGGNTVLVENNGWKALPLTYMITANTVLSFDFKATEQGEEHAIGLDDNLGISGSNRFKLYGTQATNGATQNFNNYNGSGNYQSYTIPIGNYYTGNMNYLFFIMDNDANASTGNSYFRNVVVFEDNNGNGINDECEEVPNCTTQNVALGKSTSQSSTYSGSYPASRANDDNTNGISFSHTKLDANAWWEIDLGTVHDIEDIKIFNRTSCCSDRLSDFYVFVSDVPFSSKNLTTTLNQSGVSDYFFDGAASTTEDFNINRTGRYVRVQLSGTNYLQLAEVQIMACATASPGAKISQEPTITNLIYPNPTSDKLFLNLDSYYFDKNVDYTIMNVQGQLVDAGTFGSIYTEVVEVDVSSSKFPAGTYLIALHTGDMRQVHKFVVMK